MIKKLLFTFCILCSLASCNSQSAFKYSQDIVKKEEGLTPDITATEEKIGDFLKDGKYDSVVVAATKMETEVDKVLTEIKTQPAPDAKEAESFKDASVKYFAFIKSMYTGYKALGSATTDDARQEELVKLQKVAGQKMDVITEMQRVQKQFATANGFKLENQ